MQSIRVDCGFVQFRVFSLEHFGIVLLTISCTQHWKQHILTQKKNPPNCYGSSSSPSIRWLFRTANNDFSFVVSDWIHFRAPHALQCFRWLLTSGSEAQTHKYTEQATRFSTYSLYLKTRMLDGVHAVYQYQRIFAVCCSIRRYKKPLSLSIVFRANTQTHHTHIGRKKEFGTADFQRWNAKFLV